MIDPHNRDITHHARGIVLFTDHEHVAKVKIAKRKLCVGEWVRKAA